jgi:hypothetical protein
MNLEFVGKTLGGQRLLDARDQFVIAGQRLFETGDYRLFRQERLFLFF